MSLCLYVDTPPLCANTPIQCMFINVHMYVSINTYKALTDVHVYGCASFSMHRHVDRKGTNIHYMSDVAFYIIYNTVYICIIQ